MLPFLLVLLQGPAVPRAPEDAVLAFAKGDTAAREEILKAGACLIPALRKIRPQSPDRIDALVYDIKKSSAGFDVRTLVAALDTKRTIEVGETTFPIAIDDLSSGLPLIFDPALFRSHYTRKLALRMNERPRREILEALCRQTDLDYGFFCGVVLVASPDRLWPPGPPPRATPLTADESRIAMRLVDRLGSDSVEERTQAAGDIRKLGERVIPLLEKRAGESDGERRARCQDLIFELRKPPPSGTFHLPGAARQRLVGGNEALRVGLEKLSVSFKVADIALNGALLLLLRPHDIPVEIAPSAKNVRVTLDLQNVSGWAVISLATQYCGFDFLVLDGRVVVDTRAEIERRLGEGR